MLKIQTIMAKVPDYPNYLVTIDGEVLSITKERSNNNSRGLAPIILKGDINHGYKRVQLYNNNGSTRFRLHRLMLSTFIGISSLLACHKNDIKLDNKLENLYYGTHSENNYDAVRNERNSTTRVSAKGRGLKVSNIAIQPYLVMYEEGELLSIIVKHIHIDIGYMYNPKALSRRFRNMSIVDLEEADNIRRTNKNRKDYHGLYTTK